MIANGFLGTRADLLIDSVIVLTTIIPFVMYYSIRQARKGRYQTHRNFQVRLLVIMIISVIFLELNIRFGATVDAIAESSFADTTIIKTVFIVHLFIALPTFLSWIALSFISWRGFQKRLPGAFSNKHKLIGRMIFIGLCLTSFTGLMLYIMGFAL